MAGAKEAILKGAVILANEVNGYHDEQTAQRLHGGDWQTWRRPNLADKHIDFKTIETDSIGSRLLMKAVTQAIRSLPRQQQREILPERFGLYDEQPKTLTEIGQRYGLARTRIGQIIAKGRRQLRYSKRNVFKYFTSEYPTEGIPQHLANLSYLNQDPPLTSYPPRTPETPFSLVEQVVDETVQCFWSKKFFTNPFGRMEGYSLFMAANDTTRDVISRTGITPVDFAAQIVKATSKIPVDIDLEGFGRLETWDEVFITLIERILANEAKCKDANIEPENYKRVNEF